MSEPIEDISLTDLFTMADAFVADLSQANRLRCAGSQTVIAARQVTRL